MRQHVQSLSRRKDGWSGGLFKGYTWPSRPAPGARQAMASKDEA